MAFQQKPDDYQQLEILWLSLADIVDHVKQRLPEFKGKGISCHTIHCLLVAPHKNRVAACHYRGVKEAKVPPKRNTLHSYHKDRHYTALLKLGMFQSFMPCSVRNANRYLATM